MQQGLKLDVPYLLGRFQQIMDGASKIPEEIKDLDDSELDTLRWLVESELAVSRSNAPISACPYCRGTHRDPSGSCSGCGALT
jgi:hypothetical protein